ncbi:MAG: DNA polymerase IV [Actinomycetota bacterium]|nr:DNA polymerase IV [Actinomycetota bacterium]
MRDDPSLREKPVAVGGSPDQRGVIATCNYAARRYGVHSAMSSRRALALCPDLVILLPDFTRYKAASRAVNAIFHRYTDRVEPLSLDEAYLDVTDAAAIHGSATKIAEEIRAAVHAEVGITISAGIAPNKFLAKVASDINKPDGLYVVKPRDVDAFVLALPVEKLFGVGKVTAAKMHRLGLRTCADLQALPRETLVERFGSYGITLWQLCRGIDERPVRTDHRRKSLSVENTWATDLATREECLAAMAQLATELQARYAKIADRYRVTGVDIKVKYADFREHSRQRSHPAIDGALLAALLAAQLDIRPPPIRLLGAGLKLAVRDNSVPAQQELFD